MKYAKTENGKTSLRLALKQLRHAGNNIRETNYAEPYRRDAPGRCVLAEAACVAMALRNVLEFGKAYLPQLQGYVESFSNQVADYREL
jgi:hypothetical protein